MGFSAFCFSHKIDGFNFINTMIIQHLNYQVFAVYKLTLVLLNLDVSFFVNTVDPDQLASSLIRIHTDFHSACKYMLITGMLKVNSLLHEYSC